MRHRRVSFISVAVLLTAYCTGSTGWAVEQYDYLDPANRNTLATVEKHHYNANVQGLIAGQSSAFIIDDLIFMLDFFPNHHGALYTLTKLWERHTSLNSIPPAAKASQTPDFWYERAIRFQPADAVVLVLYGNYLQKQGKLDDALPLLDRAASLAPDSAEVNYNLGLAFLRAQRVDRALQHASRAYELGFPLPGLRNKLVAAGAWPNASANNDP